VLADRPGLVLLFLLVALPLAAWVGSRLPGGGEEAQAGNISTATFGLLGLLVAFTFGMAAERYETRRGLTVAEANAISTAYLRYQLLDEPFRTRLSTEMAPYVATRLAFAGASVQPLPLKRNETATAALQGRIWIVLNQALDTPRAALLNETLLEATNEMFDLASSRQAAVYGRVPQGVRISLMGFAVLAAALLGWSLGEAWLRNPGPIFLLFLLIAFTLALIADLDQPGGGVIRVQQTAMQTVADRILRAHAGLPALR
jgi:hypothetical protein